MLLLKRWRGCREAHALAIADADDLVARFGAEARAEARQRVIDARRGATLDANRPPDHWERVRTIVARRQPSERSDTATRYLSD